jgi:hypothetical protein
MSAVWFAMYRALTNFVPERMVCVFKRDDLPPQSGDVNQLEFNFSIFVQYVLEYFRTDL